MVSPRPWSLEGCTGQCRRRARGSRRRWAKGKPGAIAALIDGHRRDEAVVPLVAADGRRTLLIRVLDKFDRSGMPRRHAIVATGTSRSSAKMLATKNNTNTTVPTSTTPHAVPMAIWLSPQAPCEEPPDLRSQQCMRLAELTTGVPAADGCVGPRMPSRARRCCAAARFHSRQARDSRIGPGRGSFPRRSCPGSGAARPWSVRSRPSR